jgi:hypothetical protein
MKLSLFEAARKKALMRQYTLIAFSIALFYAIVCTPIRILGYTNVLFINSVFSVVWDLVVTAVNYAFYWISFAYMLYMVSRFTIGNCKGFFGVYIGASAFLYVASLLASFIYLGNFYEFVLNDLLDIVMTVGFDAVQMGIVALIACTLLRPHQERAMRAHRLALTKNPKAVLKMPQWLPFASFFDFGNPLMRSSLFSALVSSGIHILTRIRYDLFFGEPVNNVDLLWIIIYYASEIVAFVVGYLVLVLLLNHFYLKEDEKKQIYERATSKVRK